MSIKKSAAGTFARIIPILFFVVMAWLVVSTVSLVAKIFYGYLALPLLIIALVLNYSVVTDFFVGLFKDLKEDTGKGLLKVGATIVGYPFVFGYLALKAWTKRALGSKRKSVKEQKKGDYIKYEEVEDEDDFLELEDIDKAKQRVKEKIVVQESKTKDDGYDNLFE